MSYARLYKHVWLVKFESERFLGNLKKQKRKTPEKILKPYWVLNNA